MTVVNNDVLRVTCKMRQNTKDVLNVYHIKALETGDLSHAAVMVEVANRMDAVYDEIIAQITNNLTFGSIEVWNVTQDRPVGEASWPTQTTGEGEGDPLPEATSFCMLFPTETARSQGRKFIGGIGEGANDGDGTPVALLMTNAIDFIATLLGTWLIGDGEFVFGNYNTLLERFARWIEGFAVDIWRTQRRRYRDTGT